jgi:outer membrane protein OmpA-like peptidoglycan-associated protein
MALDVQEITGTSAGAAARLCNFVTGGAQLLPKHVKWLDDNVRLLVTGNPSAWVDVIGYASRQWKNTGGADSHALNRRLSAERCDAVKRQVSSYSPNVRFNVVEAQGDSQSLAPNPDDGYDRAVEVYVYAAGPPWSLRSVRRNHGLPTPT